MSNQAVANRYAVALFQLAQEQGQLEQIGNELKVVKEVVVTTPDFHSLLQHPKVAVDKKKELLQAAFAKAVSKTVLNTLLLLLENKRIGSLIPLIDKYQTLSYEAQGIAEAKVYSVKALSEAEKDSLSETFAKKIDKKKLYIENIIDPKLIGGLKIRIGDRIFDGSVKGQLDRLQRQLIQK